MEKVHCFSAGEVLTFGNTRVMTVPTAHDGREGVAFVIQHKKKRLGIFTDLGHRFAGIEQWLEDVDCLYLESNYDPHMLASGPYPPWLQQRIKGSGGHISNQEAAQLIRDCNGRMKHVILAHLSEHNNCPDLALQTSREILADRFPITIAPRYEAGRMFEIE
jgi:phosphoribosyl 1,2-cyclic phosphodiesterase